MPDTSNVQKRATNLTLSGSVLDAARELGINISQTVDALLSAEVKRLSVARWVTENQQTVDAYNRRVDERGLWNHDLRKLRGQI